jgi:translation elongation factor P/translation initiation factor 5A
MTTFERKAFTNVYWSKSLLVLMNKGTYSTEELAKKNVKDDEDLIYQDSVSCQIQWTYKGSITKEKVNEQSVSTSVA